MAEISQCQDATAGCSYNAPRPRLVTRLTVIFETVVTTRNADGSPHIAPMGIRRNGTQVVIAPFRPSSTLSNLEREQVAVVNFTDDVRVFAGPMTGHADWPVVAAEVPGGLRLHNALAHAEARVVAVRDDDLRPELHCEILCERTHAPFPGFNRAQSAVIEAAILVSRLDRLPADKVDSEMAYLAIAIDKTAGERELQAWQWLQAHIADWRAGAGR